MMKGIYIIYNRFDFVRLIISFLSTTCHKLVVKLMKGDDNYRFASRSYVQFANEIYMYTQVLPQFEKLLRSSQSPLSLEDVTPRVFYGFFGQVAGMCKLSSVQV